MNDIILCKDCERILESDTMFCPHCGNKRKGSKVIAWAGPTVLYLMALVMAIAFAIIGFYIYGTYQSLASGLYSLSTALGPVALFGLIYEKLLKNSLKEAAHAAFSEQANNVCKNSIIRLGEEQDKLEDLIKRLKQISRVGLVAAFPERRYAFPYISDAISTEDKEIYIVGTSFRGLLWPGIGEEKLMAAISNKIKNSDCKVRFILTHPAFAHLRQSLEGIQRKEKFHIAQEILETLLEFKKAGVNHNDIRFVKGTPTIFGIRTSKMMLINPYPYQKQAFNSITFLLDSNDGENEVYRSFDQAHFSGVWEGRNVEAINGYDIQSVREVFDSNLGTLTLCESDKKIDYTPYKQALQDMKDLLE
ncbi:hypothetical protein [uncultured Desulfobacter sp.]|uniref:hypothetical protein n=1 Tax=uncultured Desulfobacter sp. TaxID=240139 RepID=UPI002AAB64F6|nr:hypothetical protein [uncultured Desulfobacter sp.]